MDGEVPPRSPPTICPIVEWRLMAGPVVLDDDPVEVVVDGLPPEASCEAPEAAAVKPRLVWLLLLRLVSAAEVSVHGAPTVGCLVCPGGSPPGSGTHAPGADGSRSLTAG